ncbi:MAG TPA: alpha/beta hydrolase [Phototrophicaceae bacterium]|jgi:alpha-beta hydrolase superfamily lysophospholipase|nr:alpha/beta hydrolase [Phototrophicaceae bacterium]
MSTSTLQTFDGLKLHTINWLPKGDPKAVILIVHGIGEHSGRYTHAAAFFNERGYAVYSYDHRGHGKSEGERTYFTSFDLPVEDMKRVFDTVKGQNPGKKIFVYGHSMGSLISTLFMLKYQEGVAGFISTGSPLAVNTAAPATVVAIGHVLAKIAPKMPFVKVGSDVLSHDPVVVKAYDDDPLVEHRPNAIAMLSRLIQSGVKAQAQLQRITIPLLVMHGSSDKLCPPLGSQILYDRAGSKDKTLKMYPNLYHEIHNEPEQITVFTDMINWLDTRI